MHAMTQQMTSARALLSLAGILAIGALIAGCGEPDCAEGTERVDGTCQFDASGCGQGTVLVDGVCVLDSGACGSRASEVDGECVPDEDAACGDSTTYDQETGQCVVDTSVSCGVGTELDASGQCVPAGDACQSPAVLDEEGLCVVGPQPCSAGAVLDANTNTCVSAEVDCREGLMWDESTRRCVPTDEICADGTVLDESGICLPDVCDVGDVMFGPVCVPADEVQFVAADLEHVEEFVEETSADDNHLSMPAEGGDPFVASGRLYVEDGRAFRSSDADKFTFDGEASQWVNVSLRNFGFPGARFTVTGPRGTEWESPLGHRYGAGRQIVLPRDGRYEVRVSYFREPEHPQYHGAEDWVYALVLQHEPAPEPTVVDAADGAELFGDAIGLRDNLFRLEGLGQMQSVEFRAVPGAIPGDLNVRFDGGAQLEAGTALTYEPISRSAGADGSLVLLVDWTEVEQVPAPFEIEVQPGGM